MSITILRFPFTFSDFVRFEYFTQSHTYQQNAKKP